MAEEDLGIRKSFLRTIGSVKAVVPKPLNPGAGAVPMNAYRLSSARDMRLDATRIAARPLNSR